MGRTITPSDVVEYPNVIMSLLSDAQEATANFTVTSAGYQANDMVNAAKVMLLRMTEAARKAERAYATATTRCIDCGAPNASGPLIVGRDRNDKPITRRGCEDRAAFQSRENPSKEER